MADRKKLEIELKSLWFDERNPRLPIRLQGETDENKIIDYMVKYGNIVELMLSIAEMGYSDAEPLLVVQRKNILKKYSHGCFILEKPLSEK